MKMQKSLARLSFSAIFSLVTMAACAITFVGATYAWFTFNLNTNVTPMEGTVTMGDVNLLISSTEGGSYDKKAPITMLNSVEELFPVSTNDLKTFYSATARTPEGIAYRYRQNTKALEESILHGEVFVKAEYLDADLYFSTKKLKFEGPGQLLGALRVGMIINSNGEENTYFFKLDDVADVGGESKVTTQRENVVVSGMDSLIADPAVTMRDYMANDGENDDDDPEPGQKPLCRLIKDTPARIEIFIYMEGCDENTINEAQTKDLSFDFAFCGVKVEGNG